MNDQVIAQQQEEEEEEEEEEDAKTKPKACKYKSSR